MDRSSILRASTIPFVRKASLMSEAFFMDARKGCPKLHRRSCKMCERDVQFHILGCWKVLHASLQVESDARSCQPGHVQKGRPKSHRGTVLSRRFSSALCNLERPFCTSGGDVRHLEGVHREGHVQGDDGGGGDLRGQRPA